MRADALTKISCETDVSAAVLHQATNKIHIVHGAKLRRHDGSIPYRCSPNLWGIARASLFELRRAPCFAGCVFPAKVEHPIGFRMAAPCVARRAKHGGGGI